MAEWTFPIDTEHNIYPNITIHKRLCDGEFKGWRFKANEGYVFYDTQEDNSYIDPDTNELVTPIYYYTEADKPRGYNWNNFHYVAVLRSSVPEDMIFSIRNNHEIA